jgi:protein O-mannosyl-transferase
LMANGRLDDAIAHFEAALKSNADNLEFRNNLGMAQGQRQGLVSLLRQQQKSLRSRPDDIALLNDAAWMLATNPNASIRNGPEAIELAERAVRLSKGGEPAILGTLAAAYAETGRFAEALQTAHKAAELATQRNQWPLAESITLKCRLYEAHAPVRERP